MQTVETDCPYCNVGDKNAKDVAAIEQGELQASCWVDRYWKDNKPIMSIDISLRDSDKDSYTQLKYAFTPIKYCPMCGRKLIKEDKK